MSNKFRIKFELTDEFGNEYVAESRVDVLHEHGERALDIIGEQLNVFLKQCGYFRENDYIFMEDINQEEYDELLTYLKKLREGDVLNDN